MTRPPVLVLAGGLAAVLVVGLLLWREQGVRVWLEAGLAYCF
jgi:hypothetical protein